MEALTKGEEPRPGVPVWLIALGTAAIFVGLAALAICGRRWRKRATPSYSTSCVAEERSNSPQSGESLSLNEEEEEEASLSQMQKKKRSAAGRRMQ